MITAPQFEDIPKLETDKENWDEGQFDDAELLYNHNSAEENDRIRHKYSAYFEKVEDQEYSPYHTVQGVEYHIPEQIIITPINNQNSIRDSKTKMYTYPTPSIKDLLTWYSRGRRRARCLKLHSHRLYGEKSRSLESQLE